MKLFSNLVLVFIMGLGFSANAETILLTSKNTVNFRGEVAEGSVVAAQMKLAELAARRGSQNYDIYLVLDTPGGSISAGEDFIQFAKTIPRLKTISLFAASMGSAIVEALPGERLVTENGVLMFHRAAGGLEGQFENGEMEVRLDFYKRLVRSMELRSAKRIGISLVDYKAKVKDEFWSLGAESVANKTADRVVDVSCTPELIRETVDTEMSFFIFTITMRYSSCPLLRGGTPVEPKDKAELKKAKAMAKMVGKELNARYFLDVTK